MSEVETPQPQGFEDFVKKYNESYIMKCKELGLKNEYDIEVDGITVTYIRKRLTTKQNIEIEKARGEIDKPSKEPTLSDAQRIADMYFTTAQAYLFNKETNEPITESEFGGMYWEEIKLILDACHLRTLMGVPNAVPASKT